MANIKATRMALLLTKKKLKLAAKGHKLLKEKRDALVMEFFNILKEIKNMRSEIGTKMVDAQLSLRKAQAIQGEVDVERFALGLTQGVNIEMDVKSVMSVEIPQVTNVEAPQQWYGYLESSVELDNAIVKFRELFPFVLKLSARQLAFQRLAEEIKKTKRKVNSLEYLIIPRLEGAKDFISFKLEEMERENFTRLKKIKEKQK